MPKKINLLLETLRSIPKKFANLLRFKMHHKKKEITINDLAYELMRSEGGSIHNRELLITYPVINQAQIFSRGIKEAIKSKNYIVAASLLRGLIECTMVFVYDSSMKIADRPKYYSEFLKVGRLMRWSKSKKNWVKVRDEDLINQFEKTTGIKIKKTYDSTCSILHFSATQIQLLSPELGNTEIVLSEIGPNVSQKSYDKIEETRVALIELIKVYLAAGVQKKRGRANEDPSELAEIILKGVTVVSNE